MQVLGLFFYTAEVLDIHDGDTVRLLVDLGFSVHLKIDLRLAGYNAPELNTPAGVRARELLVAKLDKCPFVLVQVMKTGSGQDARSFARYVGVIHNPDALDPLSINDLMKKELGL